MTRHLTALEAKKLHFAKNKLGQMSSAEAFALALEADITLAHLPTWDPAFSFMTRQRDTFLVYATWLEMEEISQREAANVQAA